MLATPFGYSSCGPASGSLPSLQTVRHLGNMGSGPGGPAGLAALAITRFTGALAMTGRRINGGSGDDVIFGTPGDDTINSGDGNDEIHAGAGDDLINPGDNRHFDFVAPGAGNDTVTLSDMHSGYVDISHYDLNAGVTLNIDGNANTATVDKGVNGMTQIVDIQKPMRGDALNRHGVGLLGTRHDDVFNITVDDNHFSFTSVDGGEGHDTFNVGASTNGFLRLSYRNAPSGVTVDLDARAVSSDGYGGTDSITGPGQVNSLRSSMHDDNILGSDQDEDFILMAGNDTLDAGGGRDWLRYDRTGVEAVTLDLGAGTATGIWRGEAFSHTISNVERVRGSRDGNDNLAGADGVDVKLDGRGGNDTLTGRNGNDVLIGGAADDTLAGGKGDDVLNGGDGDDRAVGQAGQDTLNGGQGNDVLNGGGSQDRLGGGDGDDFLKSGTGNDTANAGKGDDRLFGNRHDDTLNGGQGDDFLNGGGDDDRLNGGTGNDTLKGGAGADEFVFAKGGDSDLVLDFNVGEDRLRIDDALVSGLSTGQAVVGAFGSVQGGDVVLDFGGGDMIRLDGVGSLAGLGDQIDIF